MSCFVFSPSANLPLVKRTKANENLDSAGLRKHKKKRFMLNMFFFSMINKMQKLDITLTGRL